MIDIFLDSGAHSWYNKHLRGKDKKEYGKIYDSQAFWDYVDQYGQYLSEHKPQFKVAVNVDVIFDARRTWKVQKYLENKYGLDILPVYHFGEDSAWLKLYMDNYEYIGIGGLGQETPRDKYIYYGDRIWRHLCDQKGYPIRRVHGFAMTSPELMLRYPWYSVDSSSWLVGEKFGLLIVPRVKDGSFDYGSPPLMISVTTRKSRKKNHIRNISSIEKEHVLRYCKEVADFDYGKSDFITVPANYKLQPGEFWVGGKANSLIERVVEKGIGNDMNMRNILNIIYFQKLEEFTLTHPRRFVPEFTGLGVI